MERWFWIGLGGAAGTVARYGISTWCQQAGRGRQAQAAPSLA
jgi:fluoride ion exporter CrcB/FEX